MNDTYAPPGGIYLVVVSSGRPGNVPAMEAHFEGLAPTWYVPEGQGGDYRYCGAERVVEVAWPQVRQLGVIDAPPMVFQRNRALDDGHAVGATVVMSDDDLVRCAECQADGSTAVTPTRPAVAVRTLVAHLHDTELLYAGTPPTANPFFARRPHTTHQFVRDGLTAHRPNPIRYDTNLPIKIDYDMTLAHLAANGGALRCDHLLLWYRQRQKRGGCDWRTPEVEDACVEYLRSKWGADVVHYHATRAHEVSLRWRP